MQVNGSVLPYVPNFMAQTLGMMIRRIFKA